MLLKYFSIAILLLILFAVLIFNINPAFSHEWYDQACCSNRDCHPIPCEDIIEKGRILIYQGLSYSGSMIKSSKDALCHACMIKSVTPPDHPLCIYIQNGS